MQCVNMVASSSLSCELDLSELASSLHNIVYSPSHFTGASLKHRKIKGTLLLFPNGKLILTGATSFREAKQSIRRFARIIQRQGYHVTLKPIKLLTSTVTNDLRRKINLGKLRNKIKGIYEPEQFPALTFKYNDVTFIVHHTGKVIMTGVKKICKAKEGWYYLKNSIIETP